jgi:acyl-CoA reductase-like NAD-dependent aldehyde dehydrogenase
VACTWPQAPVRQGEWVNAKSGKAFSTINPATEEVLVEVAEADSADIDAAVVAARRAFEASSWAGITPQSRARMLYKIAEAIEDNAEVVAVLETLDMGAPLTFTKGRIAACAELFRYKSVSLRANDHRNVYPRTRPCFRVAC